MESHFKENNRLIITDADESEALLISKIISRVNDNEDIILNRFYNIDNEVYGLAIDIFPILENLLFITSDDRRFRVEDGAYFTVKEED